MLEETARYHFMNWDRVGVINQDGYILDFPSSGKQQPLTPNDIVTWTRKKTITQSTPEEINTYFISATPSIKNQLSDIHKEQFDGVFNALSSYIIFFVIKMAWTLLRSYSSYQSIFSSPRL